MPSVIGLDVRMIQNTGIGTYLRGLLQGFSEMSLSPKIDLKLFGQANAASGSTPYPMLPFNPPIYSIQEQLQYPSQLKLCDLWHSPHYNIPYWKGKTKLIATIHDVIHWKFRDRFFNPIQALYAKTLISRALTCADHILTVSENTKEDLCAFFNADPKKISVTYEGVSADFKPAKDRAALAPNLERLGIRGPYFLYVGMMKPHKNISWLLTHYDRMKKNQRIKAQLVLVGKKDGVYPPELEKFQQANPDSGILHIPEISREDLHQVYQGALAHVHPSLYEGFGLTLLEGMASGTPVIAFRTASIPEVVGDAGWLISPNSERELENAMTQIETSEGLREEFIKKGIARVSKFSWRTMAEQTLEIYNKVAGDV